MSEFLDFAVPEAAALTRPDIERPSFDTSTWQSEIQNSNPGSLEIVVNQEQVDAVLGTILDAYTQRQYPYNQDRVRLPHDPRHMPETLERGTRDHAMLLWNVCYYMRGGIKSVDAFKRMGKLYDNRPDLYQPEIAANADPADIVAELRAHGLGFQNTVAKQWIENSRRLVERYEGDPRNIFAQTNDYEDCVRHIKSKPNGDGFLGFREKMTSMITYYLMDEDMIEPFNFPIPVDLHVMRVSIANQLVTFPGIKPGTNVYSEELLATLRDIYFNYAQKQAVNPLRLCDAVWLLSESSCGKNPGNVTLEPLGRDGRNGRSTVLVPQQVDVNNAQQRADYDASCRSCPVEQTCELNIPGKLYYVSGNIVIRGRRVRFPIEEDLFSQ